MIVSACEKAREETGINTVALSGGVYQNKLLLDYSVTMLEERGFHVLRHHLLPPNDGGISLGQAVAAMRSLQKGEYIMCVGFPAKVVTMKDGMAVVDASGAKREVSAELIENLEPGDYVMVHAGIAIAKITEEDEDEAEDLLEGLL